MESAKILCRLFLLAVCAQSARSVDLPVPRAGVPEVDFTTERTAVATTVQSSRNPRWYKRGSNEEYDEENDDASYSSETNRDNVDEMKALSNEKSDLWGGYYDFLINEGSYKFWAVFQLATAALLIYSGFAAVYYAKVNPSTTNDYEDYFLRRRRRRRRRDIFLGLDPATFQRILDAVSGEADEPASR